MTWTLRLKKAPWRVSMTVSRGDFGLGGTGPRGGDAFPRRRVMSGHTRQLGITYYMSCVYSQGEYEAADSH